MGHMRNYTIGDVVARVKQCADLMVASYGLDAFGLPAENAAIKNKTHPRIWTNKNIEEFRKRCAVLASATTGAAKFQTCEPDSTSEPVVFLCACSRKAWPTAKEPRGTGAEMLTVLAKRTGRQRYCWRHEDTLVETRKSSNGFCALLPRGATAMI